MGRWKKANQRNPTSILIGGVFIQKQLSRSGKMEGKWKTWLKNLYLTSGRKWTRESGQGLYVLDEKPFRRHQQSCQLSRTGNIPWPNLNEEIWIAVAATGRKNQKPALWPVVSQYLICPNVPVEKSHKSADLHLSPVTYLRAEFTETTTQITGLQQEELIDFLRNRLIARLCL